MRTNSYEFKNLFISKIKKNKYRDHDKTNMTHVLQHTHTHTQKHLVLTVYKSILHFTETKCQMNQTSTQYNHIFLFPK